MIKKIAKINKRIQAVYLSKLEYLYKRIQSRLYVVPMDFEKSNILIYAESHIERTLRTIPCMKEPDTVKWIQTFMKPTDIIFDIGANVGNYSLIIAAQLNRQVKIYAFEPAWFNFMQLIKNVELNNFGKCIFPIYAALSSQNKIDWLYYSSTEYGSSMHNFGEPVKLTNQEFTPLKQMLINSFTIDKFVDELSITPNHMKIDVDGIESEIISGAAKTMKNSILRSILIELDPSHSQDRKAINEIINSGFHIFNIQKKPSTKDINYATPANYIFIRD